MQESWVLKQSVGVYSITTITEGHRPSKALFLSPEDNGVQVRHIEWLDVAVDELSAVVNPTKKAAHIAIFQAEDSARDTAESLRQTKLAELKAIGPGNLTTLPDMRDALLKVMDFLGLQ